MLSLVDSLPVQELGDLSAEALGDIVVRQYLQRALSWRHWRRFLTGQSSYTWFFRTMARLATGSYERPKADQRLWQALSGLLRARRHILCVYGSNDPLRAPFEEGFGRGLQDLPETRDYFEQFILTGANHTYSQIVWQNALFDRSIEWISRHFGSGTH